MIEGSDDDALVEMTVSSAARKNDATLPTTWRARALRVADDKEKISYLLTPRRRGNCRPCSNECVKGSY
jgi:hypothetical protein